jgi:glucose/arabinose dehydrogenase
MRNPAPIVLALLVTASPVFAEDTIQSEKANLTVTTVADGLDQPWGLVFLPDGRMLVSEKNGTLSIITGDGTKSQPITGVPEVDDRGQGGLLGLALHPDFASNRLVYMSFSEPGDGRTNSTAVARGKLSQDGAALGDVEVIFSQKPKVESDKHYGSRLVFGRDGTLFVTLGERSDEEFRVQAQDLNSHLGKVVRINDDGSVPPDNPYVGQADKLPEIWSYGHRNIQGATLHPETGALWTIEHGPRGGDEINIPDAGKNYGWPVISYGVNYDGSPVGSGQSAQDGMEQPVTQWTPVIAPGNMTFYTGEAIPAWQGHLLIGGLRSQALIRLELDGTRVTHEERLLEDQGKRIRDVVQGPDGAIYLLTDESDGEVLRVSAAP